VNIPGFNAEYSLMVANQGRGTARRRRGSLPSGVYPALPIDNSHACYNLCGGGLAYDGCIEECMGALGGDPGGGSVGGGLQEHCSKCATSGPYKGKQHCVVPGKGSYWSDC
jgi:hypothetical protein